MSDGFKDLRSPLVRAIGARVATTSVTFERGRLEGQRFHLRSLPTRMVQAANDAAHKHLVEVRRWTEQRLYDARNSGTESVDRSDCEREGQVRVLALALVTVPEGEEPTAASVTTLFRDADELAATLEPEEVQCLYDAWARWQEERSPISRARSPEEVAAFVEALGKGTIPPSRLWSCEPDTVLSIALCMATKLQSLTRPPSSATPPSSAPSDGSSPPSDSTTTITIEAR